MLGLACALAPPSRAAPAPVRAPPPPASGEGSSTRSRLLPRLGLAAAVVLWLAMAVALVLPWLSRLQVQQAARIWTRAPTTAYARLRDAASLDPLSAEPYLVAGSIALRYGELERADEQFAHALGRTPDDAYALLQRGAIASALGRTARARTLLERARSLAPREALIAEALAVVQSGRRISISALDRAVLRKAQQLG
jgi:tetratricopeptide (TPR) repeat protein